MYYETILKTGTVTELQSERDGMIQLKRYIPNFDHHIKVIRDRIKELKTTKSK